MPLHLMQVFQAKYGVQIVQAWGMTETSPLAAIARPPASVSGEEHWALRASQGRPVAGVELRLVDDEGNEVPHDGESIGEIQVRGPWITGAYVGDEDTEKFDDGWLRTGDVGRIDDRSFVTLFEVLDVNDDERRVRCRDLPAAFVRGCSVHVEPPSRPVPDMRGELVIHPQQHRTEVLHGQRPRHGELADAVEEKPEQVVEGGGDQTAVGDPRCPLLAMVEAVHGAHAVLGGVDLQGEAGGVLFAASRAGGGVRAQAAHRHRRGPRHGPDPCIQRRRRAPVETHLAARGRGLGVVVAYQRITHRGLVGLQDHSASKHPCMFVLTRDETAIDVYNG